MSAPLSALLLAEWRPTRDRLHRWARLAGAVRRQRSPQRKHWWHIGLLPCARGLTTGPFAIAMGSAELELDLHRGELVLIVDDGGSWRLPLAADPGGEGRAALRAALDAHAMVELPAFADATCGELDLAAGRAYLRVLLAVDRAFRALQAELPGEVSPIQLWPHHFDLAVSWLSGRTVPGQEAAEPEHRDETVTVGFSTGDDGDPEPYLYAIAYPWPVGFAAPPLPAGRWHTGGWNGGFLPWSEALASDDPVAAMTTFGRSAWRALATAQGSLVAD